MNQLDLGYWLAALESEDPLESWDPGELGLALSRQEYPDLDCAYYLSWLDRLAQEVLGKLADRESLGDRQQALAKVLFTDFGLRGNKESYYEPQNSFVNDVLERGRGIPISIALIWAAVGYRLSWPIHGLSFPGHVMIGLGNLMGKSNRRDYLVLDPFHPDEPLDEVRLDQFFQELVGADRGGVRPTLDWEMGPKDWLIRMLLNLRGVYTKTKDYSRLARTLEPLVILRKDEPGFDLELGFALLGAGIPAKALNRFQQILEKPISLDLRNHAEQGAQLARGQIARFN